MKKMFLLTVFAFIWGCAAEQDPERPGLCTLACDSSVIGGGLGSSKINFLGGSTEWNCIASEGESRDFSGPASLLYRAEKRVTSETAGSETETGAFTAIPNMAFEPIVTGGILSAKNSNDENVIKEGTGDSLVVKPFSYLGIVTPKSEWCSDNCGFMTLQYWPTCVGGITNNISILIHSGALSAPVTNITVEGTDPDAE